MYIYMYMYIWAVIQLHALLNVSARLTAGLH